MGAMECVLAGSDGGWHLVELWVEGQRKPLERSPPSFFLRHIDGEAGRCLVTQGRQEVEGQVQLHHFLRGLPWRVSQLPLHMQQV